MNWNQDWDRESNDQGWRDGRSGGLQGPSASMLPRSSGRRLRRLIFYVLVFAGIAGGVFAASMSIRTVGRIVRQPHSLTTPHQRN